MIFSNGPASLNGYQLIGDSMLLRLAEHCSGLRRLQIVSSTLVSGATASQLLDVVMEAPVAPRIILMIGTNDLRGECDACSLISDLAIILGWLTLHAENVVILTLPQIALHHRRGRSWQTVNRVNHWIAHCGSSLTMPVEIHRPFVVRRTKVRFDMYARRYAGRGRQDLVHWSAVGMDAVVGLLHVALL
ncbi:hypothetical protein HPB47_009876 [Ixodes persulcatus]|uniref:Uncharacterized protein n=1 Tax=Ixodes persulcatus TaxID=34615 RepID=A0AC60P0S1_IXOPE|nr:hypothetical protein HPB47_009876 [Ixodes persulcatus]